MPNIHTLGDRAARPAPQRYDSTGSAENSVSSAAMAGDSLFGVGGRSSDGSPLPTIGEILCPRFKASVYSFIFVVSVLDVLYFLAELLVGGIKFGEAFSSTNAMVGPGGETLLFLGAKFTPLIQEGQIHRLILPVFMHVGVIHIIFNLYFQCNIGFRLEEIWGVQKIAVIYLVSGIGGNLMSAVCSPKSISAGASGALFGLLGCSIAYLIVNWSDLPNPASSLCNIILIIAINFLFGLSGSVDNWAHLGGLISGVFISLAIVVKSTGIWEPKDILKRNIGFASSLAFFLLMLLLLFLAV